MKNFILFIALLLGATSFAQEQLSIRDAVLGLRDKYRPDNLRNLQWVKGIDAFSQTEKTDSGWIITLTEVPSFRKNTVTTLKKINEAGKFNGKEALASIPPISWVSPDAFEFQKGLQRYQYTRINNQVLLVSTTPNDAEHLETASNGSIAYVKDKIIHIETKSGQKWTVGNPLMTNGQSVHRNEFGIEKGLFWSLNGRFLAYYAMDESPVADYPVPNWSTTPATVQQVKYPMAGQKSHQVSLMVVDAATGKEIRVQTGEPDEHYLTNITWDPSENSLYIFELNREQNHQKLNHYSAADGKFIRTLFEEKDEKYTEPLHEIHFVPQGKGQFIALSRKDGFTHCYLYDAQGKMIRQLTKGPWEVLSFIGFDAAGKNFYITDNHGDYLSTFAHKVSLDGKMVNTNLPLGTHAIQFSHSGKYLIDQFNSMKDPMVVSILDLQGKVMKELLRSTDKLAKVNTANVQLLKLKSSDGNFELPAKLMLPANFDSTKKYPVIVYLYGGPHLQLLKNSYPASGNLWYDYMTQQGFIVFSMENRGSANRGKSFEQATFRQLGSAEMADQLQGVAYLKSLPFIDTTRMGVHGWSFGGFMTTSLMTRYPGTFQVGVAGGPVINWEWYEVMYTERYMDSPQENPEGYKNNNLTSYVKNLQGDLLMIHGTQDDVVVWQHSLNYLKKSVEDGKQVDYYVYPGHAHNVTGPDRVHLMDKISKYFIDKLK